MLHQEAIKFLYDLQVFGLKLGLENTFRLAALAGNPHERLRFIHVAGTNGKGSTCAMLESVYRNAGLRVGLFTSPHLVHFGERIQVNRVPLSNDQVTQSVERIMRLLDGFPKDHSPTFFEVVTIMALTHFAEAECDLVIWETGMGGRLDATNIVTPLATVITNIQHDHERWLGQTLEAIAFEKAGILKPNVPALTATTAPDALEVIRRRAAEVGAPLRVLEHRDKHDPRLIRSRPPLPGEHQLWNAALALATVDALQPALPVGDEAIAKGLATVRWDGRFQALRDAAGNTTILDGAHNPAGAEVLAAALHEAYPSVKPPIVMGVMRDKDWDRMLRVLAPGASEIFLVPVSSNRSATPEELRPLAQSLLVDGASVHLCDSLADGLAKTAGCPLRVVAGSLYLVGEALELLRPTATLPAGERGLNEWSPAQSP